MKIGRCPVTGRARVVVIHDGKIVGHACYPEKLSKLFREYPGAVAFGTLEAIANINPELS
jgi:hypothetical protein